jgi:hypothetical protein
MVRSRSGLHEFQRAVSSGRASRPWRAVFFSSKPRIKDDDEGEDLGPGFAVDNPIPSGASCAHRDVRGVAGRGRIWSLRNRVDSSRRTRRRSSRACRFVSSRRCYAPAGPDRKRVRVKREETWNPSEASLFGALGVVPGTQRCRGAGDQFQSRRTRGPGRCFRRRNRQRRSRGDGCGITARGRRVFAFGLGTACRLGLYRARDRQRVLLPGLHPKPRSSPMCHPRQNALSDSTVTPCASRSRTTHGAGRRAPELPCSALTRAS